MNRAWKLFDAEYVKTLLTKELIPLYPDFSSIKSLRIIPHKDNVWEETYHVVLEYRVKFNNGDGKTRELPIFCSAHSNEPRRNVHRALSYLWEHGFSRGYSTAPHPLFYSNYFRATFYRGVNGNTLYHYIKNNDIDTLRYMVPKTARWFAKLHKLDAKAAPRFNRANSRIRSALPGVERILRRIQKSYPDCYQDYKKIYAILIDREEKFFRSSKERWLVHGDAHPENVIKMGKNKLALIDYTDICRSDFARDIGTFSQQLEYMMGRKIKDRHIINEMSELFLDSYFKESKFVLTEDLGERISNYYLWTAMRTATHFLMKDFAQPDKGLPLLSEVRKELL